MRRSPYVSLCVGHAVFAGFFGDCEVNVGGGVFFGNVETALLDVDGEDSSGSECLGHGHGPDEN